MEIITAQTNVAPAQAKADELNARNAAIMAAAQPFMEALDKLKEICPVYADLQCATFQPEHFDGLAPRWDIHPRLVITYGEMKIVGGHGVNVMVDKNGKEMQLFPGNMTVRHRSIQPAMLVRIHEQDAYYATHYVDKKPIDSFDARPDGVCLPGGFSTKLEKFLIKLAPEKAAEFAPIIAELRSKLPSPYKPKHGQRPAFAQPVA